MQHLGDPEGAEESRRLLSALLDARASWFLREGRGGRCVELRRGEWELRAAGRALVLSCRGDSGARSWRVRAWGAEGEALILDTAGRAGARPSTLWLVPRALVASAREALADARRAECERLAALVCRAAGARLERATLSAGARRGEPGRWARVLFRRGRERVAATAPVVPAGAEDAESFLASALLWLSRLEEGARAGAAVGGLWLVAPPALAGAVRERVPLLRADLRSLVSVHEPDEEGGLIHTPAPTLEELLEAPPQRPSRPARHAPQPMSELAASIAALAPEEIDCVRARKGETLRYLGLAFARVRRVAGREQLWFGVEGRARRALSDEACAEDFAKLLAELVAHRRPDAPERRHALYRAAPEAWLEALLRRDVTRLDAGLRLAPLHAQFRAPRGAGPGAARPVDLLALRRDGRLVVVELKVSEDAALALQGADYWRRVRAQQLAGRIDGARLFGDAEVSDEPPLVYLAAPMLRFHRSFYTLARCVRPEIEMYRLDLNEDWRSGVRVVRRARVV
ncbi:MAG: hypothetical protein ABW250_16820 [Pyrinomonadaceae bacterium]